MSRKEKEMQRPFSCVRYDFDDVGVHINVNFHSADRGFRLGPLLTIEKLDPSHKHYKSANAFADVHGPVFHFQVQGGELESEVDVSFELPIPDSMCARSLVLLRLPTNGEVWEVASPESFRRFFADGKIFLNVTTRSFSCFTWGCCTVRAAFHWFRMDSKRTLKIILYPSQIKFPFPRDDSRLDGGSMLLEGFGMVKPASNFMKDIFLKSNQEFKIGFSFQPKKIRFDFSDVERDDGVDTFEHGANFTFTPALSEQDFETQTDMHVWISKKDGRGEWGKNTHLGQLPLLKVDQVREFPCGTKFSYFPVDAGGQRNCCFFPNEGKCDTKVQQIDPQEENALRPPLTISRKYQATTYCLFCGKSLCSLHVTTSKFQTMDIGELCLEHLNEYKSYQQSDVRKSNLDSVLPGPAGGASSKGKVGRSAQAQAEPLVQIQGLKFAFALGNGHYTHFGKLPVCRRDASKVQEVLETLNFEVQKEEDVNKEDFERAFDKWLERIAVQTQKAPCIACFSASCHGVEVDNKNYLVPIDAQMVDVSCCEHDNDKKCRDCSKGEVEKKYISLQDLLDKLTSRLPAGSLVIFLLDCCRDDPFKSINVNAHLNSKFAKLSLPQNSASGATAVFVGYATEPGKTALPNADGSAGLSPFSYAITHCLQKEYIACEDIEIWFKSVRSLVQRMTKGGMNPDSDSNLNIRFHFLNAPRDEA
jgi:hypothetical protein